MLNEEKIKIMTGVAMYEKKAGKDIFLVMRYFKSDYISSRMIRSVILYTISSVIGIGIWVLYQLEDILNTMDITVLFSSAKEIGIVYVVGLLVYLLITYIVYSRRYNAADRNMKVYQTKLRRLEKRYNASAGQKDSRRGRHS